MTRKKTTRRERALIQHAVRRAIEDYEAKTHFQFLMICDNPMKFVCLRRVSLSSLRALNVLAGCPGDLSFYFGTGTVLTEPDFSLEIPLGRPISVKVVRRS